MSTGHNSPGVFRDGKSADLSFSASEIRSKIQNSLNASDGTFAPQMDNKGLFSKLSDSFGAATKGAVDGPQAQPQNLAVAFGVDQKMDIPPLENLRVTVQSDNREDAQKTAGQAVENQPKVAAAKEDSQNALNGAAEEFDNQKMAVLAMTKALGLDQSIWEKGDGLPSDGQELIADAGFGMMVGATADALLAAMPVLQSLQEGLKDLSPAEQRDAVQAAIRMAHSDYQQKAQMAGSAGMPPPKPMVSPALAAASMPTIEKLMSEPSSQKLAEEALPEIAAINKKATEIGGELEQIVEDYEDGKLGNQGYTASAYDAQEACPAFMQSIMNLSTALDNHDVASRFPAKGEVQAHLAKAEETDRYVLSPPEQEFDPTKEPAPMPGAKIQVGMNA